MKVVYPKQGRENLKEIVLINYLIKNILIFNILIFYYLFNK